MKFPKYKDLDRYSKWIVRMSGGWKNYKKIVEREQEILDRFLVKHLINGSNQTYKK